MGGIDLDPVSNAVANGIVKADRFFDAESNGLEQRWTGRIWMNPPYSQPLLSRFAKKLESEINNITAACVLVNNATETDWCRRLMTLSNMICFPSRSVRLLDEEMNPVGAPLQGQAILYFGPDKAKFMSEFSWMEPLFCLAVAASETETHREVEATQ